MLFGPLPCLPRPSDADHRRQPHRLRLAAQAGHRRRARRAARAKRRCGRPSASTTGPRSRSSSSPTASASISTPGSALAVASCASNGSGCSTDTSASTSRSSTRSARCSGGSCPRAGTPRFRRSSADEKGIATRKASNAVQNAIAAPGALVRQRLGRPHRLDLGPAQLRGRRRLRAGDPATDATSTSGSASTSRRRSRTGSRSRSCARPGRPTSSSPTTRGRRSGSRR